MFVATIIVTCTLAVLLGFTAVRKLGHRPEVVRTYERVGVAEGRLNALAVILLVGAAGLVLGLAWAPIGVAAGIGLVSYFVLAVGAHIRAHDQRSLPTPLVMLLLSITALVLRLTGS